MAEVAAEAFSPTVATEEAEVSRVRSQGFATVPLVSQGRRIVARAEVAAEPAEPTLALLALVALVDLVAVVD